MLFTEAFLCKPNKSTLLIESELRDQRYPRVEVMASVKDFRRKEHDDVGLHPSSFDCVLSPVHVFNGFNHSVMKYFIIQHQEGAFLGNHSVTGVSVKPDTRSRWSDVLQTCLYFFPCFPQTTVS